MKNFDESTRTDSSQPGTRSIRRSGLAPLEMVLVLPILMMLMATIIVFGYAAMWKMRNETVSRDIAWRARWDRWSNYDVRPPEWPLETSMVRDNGDPVEDFEDEPVLHDPMIAGPIPEVNVNANLLDFSRGVIEGFAAIDRSPPIFGTLTEYEFQVYHDVLDDRFQYHQMGIGNRSRRLPLIWQIGLDFVRSSDAIQAAVAAIDQAPFRSQLDALDRDAEFIQWYGWAPDFHPRVSAFSSTNRDEVRRLRLEPLQRRILRLPQTMARASIRLYREQLEASTSQLQRDVLQARIDALNDWIRSLSGSGIASQ